MISEFESQQADESESLSSIEPLRLLPHADIIDISEYGFLTRNYAAYYMINLLSNAFLLSFYVVQ